MSMEAVMEPAFCIFPGFSEYVHMYISLVRLYYFHLIPAYEVSLCFQFTFKIKTSLVFQVLFPIQSRVLTGIFQNCHQFWGDCY